MILALLVALALAAPAAAHASDPANEPPFGGEPVPELIVRPVAGESPPGFELSGAEAIAIAERTDQVRAERDERPLRARPGTRGSDRWQIDYIDGDGVPRALIVIDDRTGEVIEAWTGHQVETKLARGYEGAVARNVNEAYIWLPLCALFLLPFFDFRRPFRLLHLDLLVLLGFGASHFFFNKGEITTSVPLVYPVLGYLFVRMLVAGFRADGARESRDRLVPWAPSAALVAGIVLLAALRVGINIVDSNVIDVGYAGVIGADRIVDGEELYGADFSEGEDVRGDVYGPFNYLAYVPFEQAFPWSGEWDDLPSAHAAAIAFDLLTALALLAVGRRLRPGKEGRRLGVALCFAWLAYPYTLYTLGANFNDSLVALFLVATVYAFTSPVARGALTALGGIAKFGPLAVAPLFAAGTGERRWRSIALFSIALAAVTAVVLLPLLPDGGLREFYDRSLGYQASRGSPFSIWGLEPSLEPVQTATKVFVVVLAVLVAFVPRRRSPVQLAALAGAVIIALQVSANHWFYPYTVWFAPLVFVALFAVYRGDEAPAAPERATGD